MCFGTDIVDYRTSFYEKLKRHIKENIRGALGRDNKKYKKDNGIIRCVKHAIENDCVFFDTSRAYGGSEHMLHDALKKYSRDKYYICTKLNNYAQLNDIPAKEVLNESLKQLGIDYVDLYLLHWPVENKYLDYWKQLEELYKDGLVKAIGVSNCKIHHLEEIMKIAEIKPMVNEVELHPLLSEVELRDYCDEKEIKIMAYTSTARMDFRLLRSKRLVGICQETGKNMTQVILKWHLQNGIIPIFNTSSLNHLKSNMDIYDFELTERQMKIIEEININSRTRYDSDNCEWDML